MDIIILVITILVVVLVLSGGITIYLAENTNTSNMNSFKSDSLQASNRRF